MLLVGLVISQSNIKATTIVEGIIIANIRNNSHMLHYCRSSTTNNFRFRYHHLSNSIGIDRILTELHHRVLRVCISILFLIWKLDKRTIPRCIHIIRISTQIRFHCTINPSIIRNQVTNFELEAAAHLVSEKV